MSEITEAAIADKIKSAQDFAAEGTPSFSRRAIREAHEYAEQLGTNLSNLGYSDEVLKAIERKGFTVGVAQMIEKAKSAETQNWEYVFEGALLQAREDAGELGMTVTAVIGEKLTKEIQAAAQRLGKNVDVILGVKPKAKPGLVPLL